MHTCRDIIRRAFAKLALLPAGDEPTDAEAQGALAVLQGMLDAWAAAGMFGRLDAWLAGISRGASDVVEWALPEAGAPLELPVRIRDFHGEIVTPPDAAFVEYVDEATADRRAYLYDARRAAWTRIDALDLADECPMARRGAEGLAAILAMRMAPEYNLQPSPFVVREAGSWNLALSTRYGETATVGQVEYF